MVKISPQSGEITCYNRFMYARNIEPGVVEALADTPVVMIVGARQTGKSTLVKSLAGDPRTYLTFDDATVRSAVSKDADGFVANLPTRVVLDEVQIAPEIFRSIKASVDRDRTPGRFLLTGSANVLLLPRLSESLAGRMEILTLWPLAQIEVESSNSRAGHSSAKDFNLVDALFDEHRLSFTYQEVMREELASRIVAGGFPEALSRSESRRAAWFSSHVSNILLRDLRDISNIAGLTELPSLLALLAARSASIANYSDISRLLGIPGTSLTRYLALLRIIYFFVEIRAWSPNFGLRLVRSPKIHICDTGLASSLLGANKARLLANGILFGQLLESFVVMELQKILGWSNCKPRLFHFRTQAGIEVDIVLELPSGEVVGVEVKLSSTVSHSDFRGLELLRDKAGDRFVRGAVMYSGTHQLSFGDRMIALPISALW